MEQLIQNLKSGEMKIEEVPFPHLLPGHIIVRNHYSVISAGTEGKTVSDAQKSYIGKAIARKDEVKKIMKSVQTHGLQTTYQLVMNKLDTPVALGYCCAGEVIAICSSITNIKVGDFVACGGNTANHAEVVMVPKNLCVKISDPKILQQAAFTTLGAIALQGIRQADLRLGETAVVIGLGLLGQLTLQLLRAAGVNAIGLDMNTTTVELAHSNGFTNVYNRADEQIVAKINSDTNGFGADAVIITASSASNDPVELAGELCRKKGKVIIVGAVSPNFSRANYFKKELELKMSSSYGPGRYDSQYEEKGLDYPIAYARWTENRNMQAFVSLLENKKIQLDKLTSHVLPFSKVHEAYTLILERNQPFCGIVLKYDTQKIISQQPVSTPNNKAVMSSAVVGFIGAGNFAQNFLLPVVKNQAVLDTVVTTKPVTAKNVATRFGFTQSSCDVAAVVNNKNVNTVFIATRHNTHAAFVVEALKNKKNVFVEKPLCIKESDLSLIADAYVNANAILMVGFNRRFSPLITEAVSKLNYKEPVSINYRINAGFINADHWTQDLETGGGRIIGEACHFIDLCSFIAQSEVKSVSAVSANSINNTNDTVTISLQFKNGSIASINYFANGSKSMSKENIEINNGQHSIVINDFTKIDMYGEKKSSKTLSKQDKGHEQQLERFFDAIKNGKESPIPFQQLIHSTLVTFKVVESIQLNGERLIL